MYFLVTQSQMGNVYNNYYLKKNYAYLKTKDNISLKQPRVFYCDSKNRQFNLNICHDFSWCYLTLNTK